MKFAELPDKMYCVEQKRDFFFAVLSKQELKELLAVNY